jgi:putative membrane protein
MSVHDLFDDTELAAIRDAAAHAETRTAGEIMTYVVERSDSYPEAPLRGALLGIAAGLIAMATWLQMAASWGFDAGLWMGLAAIVGAAFGFMLVRQTPALQRWHAGPAAINRRVARRAAAAFVEEEIFDTRDRTGVLLFISRFEHRVLVLGDAGINAKVAPGQWQDIATGMANGIRAGRAAEAVIEGIQACGDLLTDAGVARREDDVDELSNEVRLRDG